MSSAAIIVAAGRGTRMGPEVDKLFLEVAGKPVLAHTWLGFDRLSCIDHIVLVVRAGLQDAFRELARAYGVTKPHTIVAGGAERQDSVWNGLQALPSGTEVVAIHDGARPCVDEHLVAATVQMAREKGAAVAAQRVTDTIKESSDGVVIHHHLDRARLWSVQTPQSFRVEIIRRALEVIRAKGLLVTDDTAACEWIRQPVHLVPATRPNPKVTTPEDLKFIELVLRAGG